MGNELSNPVSAQSTLIKKRDSTLSNLINYTPDQIDLIKRTICKNSTDDELKLFMYVANKSGLDVFSRQIYGIKRWDSTSNREVMAIQTGIDGYRLIASRTGLHAGTDEATFVVDQNTGLPFSATVTVYKLVGGQKMAFTATARYSEYCALIKDKKTGVMRPNIFWDTKPFLMLEKCSEALALRKAFPAEMSGIYTEEEMEQADNYTEKHKLVEEIIPFTDQEKSQILSDLENCSNLEELKLLFGKIQLDKNRFDGVFFNKVIQLKDKRKDEISQSNSEFLSDLGE